MNRIIFLLILSIGVAPAFCYKHDSSMTSSIKHASKLVIKKGSLTNIFGDQVKIFKKYVKVFDLYFLASQSSADEKVLHGASVWYQYIDNDDNGVPDNQDVYNILVNNKATMVMFRDNSKKERKMARFDIGQTGIGIFQHLSEYETHQGSLSPYVFDAALEKCLHVLTDGYMIQYPEVFGSNSSSQIAKAMDIARGGHFPTIPKTYPTGAWYTSTHQTCDYSCQISKYLYWGMTSILGAQVYRETEEKREWKLTTRAEVKNTDVALYNLLTDATYKFPTKLPQPFANFTKAVQNSKSVAFNACIDSLEDPAKYFYKFFCNSNDCKFLWKASPCSQLTKLFENIKRSKNN